MSAQEGAQFLHHKYIDLNTSPAVESAARRTRGLRKDSKALPATEPAARIDNYLRRLQQVFAQPNERIRQAGIDGFKQILHDQYVIKSDDIPESYFTAIKRRHRQEGHGNIDIPDDQRAELAETVITDQTTSLDLWVDYLVLSEAKYPDHLKYWAIRSILAMGKYNKGKQAFEKRTKGTVSPFPELNRDALAYICDAMEKRQQGKQITFGYDIQPADQQKFRQALQQENFATLYAWANEHFNPIPAELLQKTAGSWVHYPKGSDPTAVVQAISQYSTGWCLRGEATTRRYLQTNRNDLMIYFSEDQAGHHTIPRAVIVRNNTGHITEVRGVAYEENLDPHITPVVEQKLAEFPDGKLYKKKAADMRQLTAIEQKTTAHHPLTRADLAFLYEVDTTIQGFGLHADPRIVELRQDRDVQADMLTIFDCTPSQIAHSPEEVMADTKAYVGPLYHTDPEGKTIPIFQRIGHLEHIYTQFPEKKIRKTTVEIDGKTMQQLQAELEAKHMPVTPWAKEIMAKITTATERTELEVVRLTIADLGFPSGCTTTQLFARAKELGLEFCPAELGLHYRLQYMDQPDGEYVSMGMEPITGSGGGPGVFGLDHGGGRLMLIARDAGPRNRWNADNGIAFGLRKVDALAA